MKFNWGTGIALVYGLFAVTMIAVVLRSRSHDPGLVSKDYYNLDLNYQDHMDKKHNTARLDVGVQAEYDAVKQVIRLRFPEVAGAPTGKVKCFRSSTVRDDLFLDIKTGAEGFMEIPADRLVPGRWHIEVDWQAQSTPYFNEAVVMVIRA
jgi:nitrogen fixation protein FixH